MPKLIDYAERFDDLRRAVHALTLREGAQSITLSAVAAEAGLSLSSARRLLASAVHLPELGMQWINRRALTRVNRPFPGELPAGDPYSALWNPLLRELPCTVDRVEDDRVWRALVGAFASSPWARAAQNNRQLFFASLCDWVVPAELPSEQRAFEVARLHALVVGTIECVCTGALGHGECVEVVLGHLRERASTWPAKNASGAA